MSTGLPVVQEQPCPACGTRIRRVNRAASLRQLRETHQPLPPIPGWFEWATSGDNGYGQQAITWFLHSKARCDYLAASVSRGTVTG